MTTSTLNIDLIVPTEEEIAVLEQLDTAYASISEMTNDQRAFLTALILREQPGKLLELGVSAGGSSIVMLNAIKDFPNAKLYSVDLNDIWYKDVKKKSGHFVDNYPQLKSKWELFTGNLALKYIDQIGDGIDFCLIDTAHMNPGEIFDFLMILPFLKDNAMVVFHDVTLHTAYSMNKNYFLGERAITTGLLMSAISGKKYLPASHSGDLFPNIAAIKLTAQTRENLFEIFNLLTLRWHYLPTQEQERDIIDHFTKYYDKYYIDYLVSVFSHQREIVPADKRNGLKRMIKNVLGKNNTKRINKALGRL